MSGTGKKDRNDPAAAVIAVEDKGSDQSATVVAPPLATAAVAKQPGDENHEAAQQATSGAQETDLVIREGFPALFRPGGPSKGPLIGDHTVEPIPKHIFWAQDDVIRFRDLPSLRRDCEIVFTARDKIDGQAYSAGQTFFLPATMRPRCALEGLVMTIFDQHLRHVDPTMYNRQQSGAEWWTLVMDYDESKPASPTAAENTKSADGEKDGDANGSDDDDDEDEEDEVGLHFDADYELEEQATNLLLHPRLATVTYLSDVGAPTLVMQKRSPPPNDVHKKTLEEPIPKAWLSHPKVGKHMAFDGRLLHGAPALFFPSKQRSPSSGNTKTENGGGDGDGDDGGNDGKDDSNEPQAKRRKVEPKKRITLLVNIWLNHWVMDAALLDESVCKQLTTAYEAPVSVVPQLKSDAAGGAKKDGAQTQAQTPACKPQANLKGDGSYVAPFVWSDSVDTSKPPTTKVQKVTLRPSTVDPGGEDEIALCNHTVTMKYNPGMEELHMASYSGDVVEMTLEDGAFALEVGEELPDASDDEGDQGGDGET